MTFFLHVSFALIFCNNYFTASQFLLPKKLLKKIRDLHENSDKLVSIEDSMSLYVDLSEANRYPSQDDFHLRVFNRNSNITVCDGRMVDYKDDGKFHCSFDARNADLRHGVNHFEFEVYSDFDGKRFASQRIPDIYLFDHYLHEGYYENFYASNKTGVYAAKIIICSLTALSVAFAIDIGPAAVGSEINRVIAFLMSTPQSFLRKSYSNLFGSIASGSKAVALLASTPQILLRKTYSDLSGKIASGSQAVALLASTPQILLLKSYSNLSGKITSGSATVLKSLSTSAAATASHSVDFFNHGIVISTKASRATGTVARVAATTVGSKVSSGFHSFLSLAGRSATVLIVFPALSLQIFETVYLAPNSNNMRE
jgi:hypothetical protein